MNAQAQPDGSSSGLPAELHGLNIDHALLDARKRAFDEFGYVVIEDALDAVTTDQLLAAIEIIRPAMADHPHRNRIEGGLNVRPVIDKHSAFRSLLMQPTTFPTVVRLLDHYNIQLIQSNLIEAEPSAERRLTGWHSDGGIPAITVNGIRAFGSLKVGYFLRDLSAADDMGALMLVPGSHRMQGAPPFPPGARDPIGATALKLKAGSAVIFHQGIWHAAAPNRSRQTRVALYYGYGYRVFRPVDYQHMPAHVLDGASPLERQLLGETVTHQGYYVPTAADVPLRAWFTKHFGAADVGQLERVGDVALDH